MDQMRRSSQSTCGWWTYNQADFSFLFTFEEFAREMLFLLDTVIEVSRRQAELIRSFKRRLHPSWIT